MTRYFLYLTIVFLCTACSKDSSTEELPFEENLPRVDVLFSPQGFGDGGYNDNIFYGILKAAREHGFTLRIHCPNTPEKGWAMYEEWKNEAPDGGRRLFVFASAEYEALLRQSAPQPVEGHSLLCFEAEREIPHVTAFRLDMYGAAYCIGQMANPLSFSAAILMANREDAGLQRANRGFEDGYMEAGGERETETYYLADKINEGYDQADMAYRLAHVLYMEHSFVFPLAGNSNAGVLQYTRENPHGIYTAGMDADKSAQSTQVIASVVKRMDLAVQQYIGDWMAERPMEGFALYGLDTDFVDVVVSDYYKELYDDSTMEDLKKKAIEKEKSYVEEE